MTAHEEHRRHAPKKVSVALITVSTSRYEKASKKEKLTDESGLVGEKLFKEAGYTVKSKKIVNDEVWQIRLELLKSLFEDKADAAILMGGTGITGRDVTVEAVRPLLKKELDGFSEIFRSSSYKSIGTSAYLSRAIAGSMDGKLVFCLPGSPQAVETGVKIIIPELPHTIYMASI